MTVKKALDRALSILRTTGTSSATLDAEVLLSFVLKATRTQVLCSPQRPLTQRQYKRFLGLVMRRAHGWPIAYLTGHKEFYGLDFVVTKDVLVPRPETETLIDVILKKANRNEQLEIVDIGTGSGCIAITLARYMPHAKITALDLSPQALAIAKKNARIHKVLKKIRFIQSDLFSGVAKKHADIIVANLPYLTRDQLRGVPHEPKMALYGGKMGLELIEQVLQETPTHLNENGKVFLEIDPRQTEAVRYVVERCFSKKHITYAKDLAGSERVVYIQT
ncbi:MAG: peptide chain release factor N(5)-glutamine methyltransferase [Parcubacteria group bacterium]